MLSVTVFPVIKVFALDSVFSPVIVCVPANVTNAPVVALSTYAVVAIFVELSPLNLVGAVPCISICNVFTSSVSVKTALALIVFNPFMERLFEVS